MLRPNFPVVLTFALGLLVSFFIHSKRNDNCNVTIGETAAAAAPQQGVFSARVDQPPGMANSTTGKASSQKPKNLPPLNIVRPRYYSTELGIREKLLVGVMTTGSTVSTLAVALNKTLGHLVDRLLFFMDAGGAERAKVSELKLPGIVGFVDSRDVLRPFHVVKYLTDNFLNEYDFFFLVKDTAYVNARYMMKFVRDISVRDEVHAGPSLFGSGSSFCSLDSGILLSNSVLRKVQNSLDWCVKNAFSDSHEDNLGRCIVHASHLSCSNDVHGRVLESVVLDDYKVRNINLVDLKAALSYYPIRDHHSIYKLHLLLTKRKLSQLESRLDDMKRDLNMKDLTWPPGSYPAKVPSSRFDVLVWQYFNLEQIHSTSDFVNVKPLTGPDFEDAKNVISRAAAWVNDKYAGELRYKKLVNGYRKFDPSRGLDYILDLSFKDNYGREIVKRIKASKTLGKVELLQMPYVTETTRVHLLLPLQASDTNRAVQFMSKYSESCSQTELTFLMLILLYEPNAPGKGHSADVFKHVKNKATSLSSTKHRDCKIAWISIRVPLLGGQIPIENHLLYFALSDLVSTKLPGDSLVLFSEPNMELKTDYLNRVRMGTIQSKLVYSPIPFMEYDPVVVYRNVSLRRPNLEIHKNTGRFDEGNTRHISFYLNDYLLARRNITYIPTVKSDKDILKIFNDYKSNHSSDKVESLLDMFSRSTTLSVLRATEPSLRLNRLTNDECVGRKTTGDGGTLANLSAAFDRCDSPMGTRSQLGQLVLDLKNGKL